MAATRLTTRRVAKPWGRRDLGPWFAPVPPGDAPIGEIWFEAAGDPELLVKFLFTSARLSVQVHPDDASARAAGHARGKDEAWVILAADPGATIGIGLVREVTREELRAAALDGSIVELIDWRPAAAGQVIYSPARTVHAIGAGVTLVEVQQNVDLTYRLYDYGSARELHLEAGVAVSDLGRFTGAQAARPLAGGGVLIAEGPKLAIERWTGPATPTTPPARRWVVVLGDGVTVGGETARPGETWLVDAATEVGLGEAGEVLVARGMAC